MELKQAKKSLTAAMCAVLLSCIGIALPYPILAPYFLNEITPLTQYQGLPPKLLLGFILAVYPLGVLIGSAIIGAASDVWGRKKLLLLTLGLSSLGYIGSALAFIYESFPLLIITRFLTGFCEGNISVAKAIAVDLSPTLDKTKTFSLINATGYAGWLLGPFIGGMLYSLGIDVVFIVAVVITLCAVILIAYLLPKDLDKPSKTTTSIFRLISKQNSFVLLKHNGIKALFFIYLLATLGLNAYYEFYPLVLVEKFSFSSQHIGFITVLLTTFMIITSVYFVATLKEKIGLSNGSFLGLIMLSVGLGGHIFISEPLLWLYYALIGICIAIFNGFIPVYMSEKYADVGQGQLMGLITTTFSLANIIMALLGSAISLISTQWAIGFGAFLAFISAILFKIYTKKIQSSYKQSSPI